MVIKLPEGVEIATQTMTRAKGLGFMRVSALKEFVETAQHELKLWEDLVAKEAAEKARLEASKPIPPGTRVSYQSVTSGKKVYGVTVAPHLIPSWSSQPTAVWAYWQNLYGLDSESSIGYMPRKAVTVESPKGVQS